MTSGNLPVAAMTSGASKPKFRLSSMKHRFPKLTKCVSAAIMMGLYILWAVLFYGWAEKWSAVDSIYFAAVTMSTVGYGDLSPSDNATSEMVTVLFIFFGIVGVFGEVSSCITMLVHPFFKCCRDYGDKLFPQKTIDLDGDGGSDFKVPRGPLVYYTKNLLSPFVVILLGQNLWAIGYWQLEGWSYRRAWYHCMTTMTTVGYGDCTIATDSGKLFATFHLIFSVSLLGSLISEIFELMASREKQLQRADLLKKRLDPELIRSLDKDGGGLDKAEFVLGMLYKLDLVKEEDATPYLKQFHQLDVDGSGVLTSEDLEIASKQLAEKHISRGKKSSSTSPQPSPQSTPARRAQAAKVQLQVGVRRGETGFGFKISSRNVIESIQAGGSAQKDNELKVGDTVIAVDGHELLYSNGALMLLKELFQTLQKQPVHSFTVERSGPGSAFSNVGGAVRSAQKPPPSPMFLSPALPQPEPLPSPSNVSDETRLRTSIAYAWGALDLPQEKMQQFMEMTMSSSNGSLTIPLEIPRMDAALQIDAAPGASTPATQQFV